MFNFILVDCIHWTLLVRMLNMTDLFPTHYSELLPLWMRYPLLDCRDISAYTIVLVYKVSLIGM